MLNQNERFLYELILFLFFMLLLNTVNDIHTKNFMFYAFEKTIHLMDLISEIDDITLDLIKKYTQH